MFSKTIRPYEMSVWSLTDSYLATLKAPGIEGKGQIEEVIHSFSTDGTSQITFKVPMYYMLKDKKIENPFWYDIKHGLLLVGLRKIKIIYNKGTDLEEVFEFLINKVVEEHSNDGSLYCSVEGSGLAFEELGKKGIKISLSYDTYETDVADFEEWLEEEGKKPGVTPEYIAQLREKNMPISNINYWCDKVFKNLDWSYSIQMDWSYYDGYVNLLYTPLREGAKLPSNVVDIAIVGTSMIEEVGQADGTFSILGTMKLDLAQLDIKDFDHLTEFLGYKIIPISALNKSGRETIDNLRESYGLRRTSKIYEDEYVASWSIDDKQLIPERLEKRTEKQRIVEASNSNIYNITQTIAETFGVYCRYKYYYDDNYHIIGKEVIFYNVMLDDLDESIDLNYGYTANSINRTMDSNDLCTKMIVSSVQDDTAASGLLSIANCSANKSQEDYLLNFDYLYLTNSIAQDQYEAVPVFENQMGIMNRHLKQLAEKKMYLTQEINNLEANKTLLENSVEQVRKLLEQNISELMKLTNNTGVIVKTQIMFLKEEEKSEGTNKTTYCGTLSEKGIIGNTITLHYSEQQAENDETTGFIVTENNWVLDENQNIIGLQGIQVAGNYSSILVKFSYNPREYYNNVLSDYQIKYINYIKKLKEVKIKLDGTGSEALENESTETREERLGKYKILEELEQEYDAALKEKQSLIYDFEKMMGPALREGTWDASTYTDLSNIKELLFKFDEDTNKDFNSEDEISIYWDDEAFEGENTISYEEGANQQIYYYPYIELTDDIVKKIQQYLLPDTEQTLYFKCVQRGEDSNVEFINGQYQISINIPTDANPSNIETKIFDTLDELENYILSYGAQHLFNKDLILCTSAEKARIRGEYGLAQLETHLFALDSQMQLGFIEKDSKIIPILYLTQLDKLEGMNFNALSLILNNESALCVYKLTVTDGELKEANATEEIYWPTEDYNLDEFIDNFYKDATTIKVEEEILPIVKNISVITPTPEQLGIIEPTLKLYYPRIRIKDFSLNTNDITITNLNGTIYQTLDKYEDLSVLSRDDGYYITIKSQRLLDMGYFNKQFKMIYKISNAELSIYLDAKEIMKTNAFPQVTYEVQIMVLQNKYLQKLYAQLGRLVYINDYELKFENILGYISQVTLNLDKPWEDTVEIKNYKTKFEDLFSKIIASTSQMQANGTIYNKTASCFTSTGLIQNDVLQSSLANNDFKIELIQGDLTIDKVEGIRAVSDAGIVMLSGGGLYCATQKNIDGVWQWNTGISPKGINASLIRTGQLDTNLINIYGGEDLRFQLNADGLFAYKSNNDLTPDTSEYVVHNNQGLFLTHVDKNTDEEIDLVEVSWDGLIIRNADNEEVFYADDSGNLTLNGTIQATNGYIAGWKIDEYALTKQDPNNILRSMAGIASAGSNLNNNWLSESVYKVFWAGPNKDNSHNFYVDSNGGVYASSVIVENTLSVENLVVKGVPIEQVLPQLLTYKNSNNLYVTPLDGLIFYKVFNDNVYDKISLQFMITNPGVALSASEITFSRIYDDIKTIQVIEEEEIEVVLIEGQEEDITNSNIIEWVNINNKYLTFAVNYNILKVEDNEQEFILSSVNLVVKYKGQSEIITLTLGNTPLNGLDVIIESDGGIYFQNGSVVHSSGETDDEIILRARVCKNGEEIQSDKCYYKWYRQIKNNGIVTNTAIEGAEGIDYNEYQVVVDNNFMPFSDVYICDVVLIDE